MDWYNVNLAGEVTVGVEAKVRDWNIVVSEFELQSRFYIHFRINTRGKGMNPLIFQI